jgi:hypothetical protein
MGPKTNASQSISVSVGAIFTVNVIPSVTTKGEVINMETNHR